MTYLRIGAHRLQTTADRDRRLFLAMAFVMALMCWHLAPLMHEVVQHWNADPVPSWIGLPPGVARTNERHYDLDNWLIHGGVMAAPHFRDTLRWWVGTWAGQVPFCRPIPSLLFWIEWKLFGNREIRYLAFGFALYPLVVYQFLRLVCALARHFRSPWPEGMVLVTGLLFVNNSFVMPHQADVVVIIVGQWKQLPDITCALLFFLALRRYLEATAADPAPGPQGVACPATGAHALRVRLPLISAHYAPLGYYLACCASKEVGVFLPLLLPIIEWPALSGRDRPCRYNAVRRMAPLLAALPLFLVFRALCLHTLTGYTYGSGRTPTDRILTDCLGLVSSCICDRDWLPIALSVVGLVLIWALHVRTREHSRPLSLAELLVWAGATIALLYTANLCAMGWTSFSQLGLPGALWVDASNGCWRVAVGAMLTLLAVIGVFRRQPCLGFVSYAWVFLAVGLNSFSPLVIHRFFMTDAGFAILIGSGLRRCPTITEPGFASARGACGALGRRGYFRAVPKFMDGWHLASRDGFRARGTGIRCGDGLTVRAAHHGQ